MNCVVGKLILAIPSMANVKMLSSKFVCFYNEQRLENFLFKPFILGLCPNCSLKLNYYSKKREVKRAKKSARKSLKTRKHHRTDDDESNSCADDDNSSPVAGSSAHQQSTMYKADANDCPEEPGASTAAAAADQTDELLWQKPQTNEDKSREEEFDDYLEALLL